MKLTKFLKWFALCLGVAVFASSAFADENLFGYVKGSETLPKGAWELYEVTTLRSGKGRGDYTAWNLEAEAEYGVTHRLSATGGLNFQSIDTKGLVIDGYLPGDKEYGPKLSGMEAALKYNFLAPAKDNIGLSGTLGLDYA